MDNTVGSLTQLEKSIITGSLLGDGYLRIVPGRRNALLEINHTIDQKEYVDWKYKLLKSICKTGPVSRNGNGRRIAYRFNTRQHTELTKFHELFYVNGKKQVPENLILDPIILAVWYMDDGSKCRESDVYLNTQQFNSEYQDRCVKMLSDLGIESGVNKDKEYKRIRIIKNSIPAFFKIITPHIIPSMFYKLSYNPVETYFERNGVARLSS